MQTKKVLNYSWKYTISGLIALSVACIFLYIMNIAYTAVHELSLSLIEQASNTFNDKLMNVALHFLLITFPYMVFYIITPICSFGIVFAEMRKYFKLLK